MGERVRKIVGKYNALLMPKSMQQRGSREIANVEMESVLMAPNKKSVRNVDYEQTSVKREKYIDLLL